MKIKIGYGISVDLILKIIYNNVKIILKSVLKKLPIEIKNFNRILFY